MGLEQIGFELFLSLHKKYLFMKITFQPLVDWSTKKKYIKSPVNVLMLLMPVGTSRSHLLSI